MVCSTSLAPASFRSFSETWAAARAQSSKLWPPTQSQTPRRLSHRPCLGWRLWSLLAVWGCGSTHLKTMNFKRNLNSPSICSCLMMLEIVGMMFSFEPPNEKHINSKTRPGCSLHCCAGKQKPWLQNCGLPSHTGAPKKLRMSPSLHTSKA